MHSDNGGARLGDDDNAEEQLEAAKRILDALPPDQVRQMILDAGMLDPALDSLAQLARSADDPEVRAEAQRFIRDHHIEEILIDDSSPTGDDL